MTEHDRRCGPRRKRYLEKAFDLIDSAPDESRLLGRGVTTRDIQTAEAELNIKFPSEYAEFLLRYGYGGVGGFEIFGLPAADRAEDFPFPHVVELNREMRAEGLRDCILAFKIAGSGEAYGLDLSDADNPRVVVFWPGDVSESTELEVVSESFGEYLLSEIERARSRMGID